MSTLPIPRRATAWLAWLPALIWAGVIWELGGDQWNASTTGRVLLPLVRTLLPFLEPQEIVQVAGFLRKLAHPGVYGLLAGLCLYAASRTARGPRQWARASLALIPVVLLATADEWRQAHSTARTGAVFDVVLDFLGGLAVVGCVLLAERILGRRLWGRRPLAEANPEDGLR